MSINAETATNPTQIARNPFSRHGSATKFGSTIFVAGDPHTIGRTVGCRYEYLMCTLQGIQLSGSLVHVDSSWGLNDGTKIDGASRLGDLIYIEQVHRMSFRTIQIDKMQLLFFTALITGFLGPRH